MKPPDKSTQANNAFAQLIVDLTPRYGAGEARSIARIVFEDTFHTRQPDAFHFESQAQETLFRQIRQKLIDGTPLQYVLGEADFFGYKFRVTPAVLIPRQETEELVDRAIRIIGRQTVRVLDIGTGSGCIAVTIAAKCRAAEVWALDVSPAALAIARENAAQNGAEVNFHQADILDENCWPQLPVFDVILSNPPYIPEREMAMMPEHVWQHEPHLALFVSNDDPLLFYRKIADFALKNTPSGTFLLFECNEFNAAEVAHLLQEKGFVHVELQRDLAGADRMVVANTPS